MYKKKDRLIGREKERQKYSEMDRATDRQQDKCAGGETDRTYDRWMDGVNRQERKTGRWIER